MNKTARIISNTIYVIGVIITVTLSGISLFGSTRIVNPDAMLPLAWKEQAFIWLAFGAIPMLLACMAVYKFNGIKSSTNRKRNFVLVFLPGFICCACALFVIGVLSVGMVNSFLRV